nr:MAG TPA: hypothetical protein [Caudoviricetes sp.]
MTREQAKQNLIAIGVEEPTDEQVSNYLNQVNGETKKEKDRADGYKAKADAADELQKQLDELQTGNLTELEKANKALDTANQQIAELQKNNAIRDLREKAMTDFKVTAERAKAIVKEDGSFDTAELGKIISEKETAAAQAKEQEIAKGSTNPGGGAAGGNKAGADNKTNAEKIAESLISNAPKNNDVLSHYIQQ